MYRVDITADLNDEDQTGYLWTFLDGPARPRHANTVHNGYRTGQIWQICAPGSIRRHAPGGSSLGSQVGANGRPAGDPGAPAAAGPADGMAPVAGPDRP
jgi:hypothetical protein